MRRIELLLVLMTSLGLAAQVPETVPKTDAAAQVPDSAPKPDVARQDAAGHAVAPPGQPTATEAASVSTSASASFSPLPADVSTPSAVPPANTELQSQIEEALRKDPALSKCSVIVAASADGIDLTGNAGSSRERLAAWRLAESYARGKKVENHIVVNGQGGGQAPPASRPDNATPAANPAPSTAASRGSQNKR
jgi:BON domain-containing protein